MKLAKAYLFKTQSADNVFRVNDDMPVGKEYVVDLDSKETKHGFNFSFGFWSAEMIRACDTEAGPWDDDEQWFPVELLKIEEVKPEEVQ